jgi:2-acylglycerol O-acyltransferase 2
MNLFKDIFCQVTLGIIVGAPLLIVFGLPALLYLAYRGSFVAGTLLVPLVYLTLAPLPKPNDAMFTSFVFRWWCEYFDLTVDVEYVTEEMKNDADTRFLIFDFPHGIFPFGSLLALHYWKMIFPNRKGGGVAADIVFKIPFVRQLMSLLRMLPAKRKNITKLLDAGVVVGVIPGGIAEMFLGSGDREQFYFRKRRNTVKMAIQEGATILPFLFFGHSRCFKLVGKGGDSWLMRLSRKMRASIVFFYGTST